MIDHRIPEAIVRNDGWEDDGITVTVQDLQAAREITARGRLGYGQAIREGREFRERVMSVAVGYAAARTAAVDQTVCDPPEVNDQSWKYHAHDFDAMADEAIEEESVRCRDQIAEAQSWLEAVASWEVAGKPRSGPAPSSNSRELPSYRLLRVAQSIAECSRVFGS